LKQARRAGKLPGFPQAKKTPLGVRGVRVIVVVANSVSASAPGGGGFLLLLRIFLLLFVVLLLVLILLASMSEIQYSKAWHHRNLFVRMLNNAIAVPVLLIRN